MSTLRYLDLDLVIDRGQAGYRAHLNSPGGQTTQEFVPPLSNQDLAAFRQQIVELAGTSALETAKAIGVQLFGAVFSGETFGCLRSSLDEAARQDIGLRLRLHLTDAPDLAELPWEYLYQPGLNRFFALSTKTPIVRFLDLPESIRPLPVRPPLRMLVMIANAADQAVLDVEREWTKLGKALAPLERRGAIVVERLDEATLEALQLTLRRSDYHILHFIGHGAFEPDRMAGTLLLEEDQQHSRAVSGEELGTLLRDHGPLRLVVLNACESARASQAGAFVGIAQRLVQQGIPAVVAMQFNITDAAATIFAETFYGAIADGFPVDATVTEARKAINARYNALEWGTPVLFMRAPDGRIFDTAPRDEELRPHKASGSSAAISTDLVPSSGALGEHYRRNAMDPATIAATVIGLLTPYLTKAGEAVAQQAGEAAWQRLQSIYGMIKSKLASDAYAAESLKRLETDPASKSRQAAFEGVLEEQLKADPGFLAALGELLEADQAAGEKSIRQYLVNSGKARDIFQIGEAGTINVGDHK